LRLVLAGQYVDGNSLESLGAAGIEFDRTGKMSVNTTVFNEALKSNGTDLRTLFMGDGVNPGVFDTLATTVERYTDAGAVLSDVKDRINEQIRTMDTRMADMEARLETRRAALQREYTAADSVITQLNSQMGSLSSLGSQYSLF
jgi:flagellar hook-associated protein 2